jgi:pimeloyl-ACP methyl ester carboxylesterase
MGDAAMQAQTHFVDVPGGQLAYDDTGGTGPLIVCTPGAGDRRQLYRFLGPALAEAGYRVVTMDPRGHGESSTGWPTYSAAALGSDIVALIRHLDDAYLTAERHRTQHQDATKQSAEPPGSDQHNSAGPRAIVIAESITTASAVWAAAEAPDQIAGLVLCGPAGGGTPPSAMQRAVMKVGGEIVGRLRWAWLAYWSSLFKSRKPADFAGYKQALRAMLAEPGRMAALHAMMREIAAGTANECNARMPEVSCPTLVVMGSKDPDSHDPAAEAADIAERLRGRAVLIEGAGHYPMAEFPDRTVTEILPFLKQAAGA